MLTLSYIIATKDRLSFLKILFDHLLPQIQDDEEIVVVDGGSDDGSKEYLQILFEEGKIHQFISEPDRNQAHGWNKALLMAKGIVIKKLIDDDVFCYKVIRACKDHMMQYPAIDVIISNDLGSNLEDHKEIKKSSRLPQFEKWRNGHSPSFTFGDVHMLIRRSSLSYIGLYNTAFVMMDWEYSLRISHLKANIAYYTGYNALSVTHPQTVSSLKNVPLINEHGKRGGVFYEYAGDTSEISFYSKMKIWLGKIYFNLKSPKTAPDVQEVLPSTGVQEIYSGYYQYLENLNSTFDWEFIH